MINWRVDVNHIDSLSSQTALFYAAREGHVELCKLLMDVFIIIILQYIICIYIYIKKERM
jgi:hypothetical protein